MIGTRGGLQQRKDDAAWGRALIWRKPVLMASMAMVLCLCVSSIAHLGSLTVWPKPKFASDTSIPTQLASREPRVHYSILTLEWSLQSHPERRQNVERIEREFPQFVRDIAVDASTEYDEINRIFERHSATCDTRNILSLGNHGLWASTLRSWERLIDEKDKWDFAVVVQDDHIYDEKIDRQISKMVRMRWKYFQGENSLPMYSFGHGDGINLYTVSALPRLISVFQDKFGKVDDDFPGGGNPFTALDHFYDSLGLASENMNFAWSKILATHENSTLNNMHKRVSDGYDIKCSPDGKLARVEGAQEAKR